MGGGLSMVHVVTLIQSQVASMCVDQAQRVTRVISVITYQCRIQVSSIHLNVTWLVSRHSPATPQGLYCL